MQIGGIRFLICFLVAFLFLSGETGSYRVAGYHVAQNGVMAVSDISWNKYTHIIHFAGAPGVGTDGNGNGTVALHYLTDAERSGQLQMHQGLQLLKLRPGQPLTGPVGKNVLSIPNNPLY